MDRLAVLQLLDAVREGRTTVDVAVERLAVAPVGALAYATVDTHRALRTGVPEVIYGAGKTAAQVAGILAELLARGQDGLVTRLAEDKAVHVMSALPRLGRAMPTSVMRNSTQGRMCASRDFACKFGKGFAYISLSSSAAFTPTNSMR